ncbi:phage tail protein I [uncultured Xylophilus sp.]|uniref:phage tail protein I n=1 Tax=uncultured Xylophilus sp. TaxID=296832 RepID=UPI0025D09054|nr:phage tail protein I [uncultured Xylophilus sp.]
MSERTLLLPPNQSALDAALAVACAPDADAADVARLWDAQRCPLPLLPWLAWALSVDEWDADWTEAQQRATVAASIALHRKKGTPWAVRQALERAGIEQVRLVEHIPGAHWAEFDVDLTVVDRPLVESVVAKIAGLVDAYKPARSHLRRLVVSVGTIGSMRTACATFGGDITTVYPHSVSAIEALPLAARFGLATHDHGSVAVYPRAA